MLYKKNLKVICITVATSFLLSYNAFAASKEFVEVDGKKIMYSPVNLVVNNNKINDLSISPFIYNDYLLAPVREVFEPMGAFVEYREDVKEVSIVYKDKLLVFIVDQKFAKINGNIVEMPISAKIIKGKLMVPLRFATEQTGINVDWSEDTRTAFVTEIVKGIEVIEPQAVTEPQLEIEPQQTVQDKTEDISLALDENLTPKLIVVKDEVPLGNLQPEDIPEDLKTESIQTTPSTNNTSGNDISTDILVEADFPKTIITNVVIPENSKEQKFVIEASSPITKVDKTILEGNKLVLDIRNADMGVTKTTRTLYDNPNTTEVRIGNDLESDLSTTRVVFDLKAGVNFEVLFSQDRTKIYVVFETIILEDVSVTSDREFDYIRIKSDKKSIPVITFFADPNRIVLDINGAKTNLDENKVITANYTENLRVSQIESNIVRIIVNLNQQAKYEVTYDNNSTLIKLAKPTHKNISYDSVNRKIVIKKVSGKTIEIANELDVYTDKKYFITLNADYSNEYGYGEYIVNDKFIKTIDINQKDGKTQFLINETQIIAPTITEDRENIYITATLPKEKYERIVILDPGHGAQDNGAAANGLLEKEINVDMSNKVMKLIERDNLVKGYLTRIEDIKVPLNDRAEFANGLGDLFISFHNNANPSSNANGTEVFYYNHDNDNTIGIASKTVADIMQKSIVSELGSFDRKVKTAAFVVIKNTKIPAVLLEVGFLTNREEAALLATDSYRQKSAEAIYKGILETFEIYTPKR